MRTQPELRALAGRKASHMIRSGIYTPWPHSVIVAVRKQRKPPDTGPG